MAEHWESNRSIWQLTFPPIAGLTLASSESADVCIIGAGMAGLSVAYELARSGVSVVVLDDNSIGAGMSGRTTAHLVNALDDRYCELERLLGKERAALAAQSHTAAIERIATIVREERIDCDFERLDGFLFEPHGERSDLLEREFRAARRAGINVQWTEHLPLGVETGPALRFPNQAQFHPIKYLAGLASVIRQLGGRIYTGCHAAHIDGGVPARITTASGHLVEARNVVVATNSPVNDRFVIHTKQAPYTTYVIGLGLQRDAFPRALFWDTAQEAGLYGKAGPTPYHYVRIQSVGGRDVLLVGGQDHKSGQSHAFEERFHALESWARQRFPKVQTVEYQWSGQVMEPVDGMAFIGVNPADEENVFIVTGDSGNGMTHGAVAGMLLRDLILHRENRWADLYDPHRITLKAASDYIYENSNVAAQMRDYMTGGDIENAEQLAPGSGAVVREGMSKVAVFRDEAGCPHRFSAACPHLRCIVHWNDTEHTWDCPCHGSRFDAMGTVISGPANSNLKPAEAGQHVHAHPGD